MEVEKEGGEKKRKRDVADDDDEDVLDWSVVQKLKASREEAMRKVKELEMEWTKQMSSLRKERLKSIKKVAKAITSTARIASKRIDSEKFMSGSVEKMKTNVVRLSADLVELGKSCV